MSYQAIICKANIAPHPNADRLQICYIKGFRCVVGMDIKDGDLVVFFPSDGQLSPEYANANDLIARFDPNTKERLNSGYFDANRRVRAQSLRQVKSEGFVAQIKSLAFTGYDLSLLNEGDCFDSLNKIPICQKYFTPATLKLLRNTDKNKNNKKEILFDFPMHSETAQFRFVDVPNKALIYITSKVHGTSVRYGNVLTKKRNNWFVSFFTGKKYKEAFDYVLGTRRVVLPKLSEYDFAGGFYGNGDPYTLVPELLHGKLHEGEIIYGEIAGYLKSGKAMFHNDTSKINEVKNQYGKDMPYSYGCMIGQSKFFVYRITQNGRDLSWLEILDRCAALGVEPVYEVDRLIFDGSRDALNAKIESLLEGPAWEDDRHIREGVCLRIETPGNVRLCKAKSFTFKVLEGIVKDNADYVDMEEIA